MPEEESDEATKKGNETAKKGVEAGEKAAIKAGGAALGPEGAAAAKVVAEVPFFRKILEGGLLAIALGILGIIALIVIGIIALISVLGPLGFGNRPSLSGNPYDSPFDCNVAYPQNADEQKMAAYIDSIIPSGSPLRGLGKNFVSTAKAGNKNPLFIAHFAKKESSWGTAGIARGVEVDGRIVPTLNPFGRKAGSNQPSAGGWYKFSSWEEAVNLQGPYLKSVYQDQGLHTIQGIINKYCPESDGCDTKTYTAEIRTFISTNTQKANGSFGVDPCTTVNLAGAGGPHSGSMTWPLPGHYALSSTFHSPSRPTHNGIDMPAPEGTPIVAAADGVVEKIFVNEPINGYGVKLNHQNGIKTAYLHFIPGSVAVQLGQSVKAGQIIGKIDNTGRSTGNHLHFGVQVNGAWVNPCGGFVKC
ncbi:MAG: peptidase M23 [Candidatus Berkelbacteria bacterium Licking1014_96]|uniref:Peptidase M23 n=1 Tax=Candidatus Berkelbacteria bacterium Licking1014_96 TaxID=2017149 RepID=A0A554LF69_9BACT|nr:MAG: peptidase M23 [Candidatus Berkelbacteria bacterium Licking1014_96]